MSQIACKLSRCLSGTVGIIFMMSCTLMEMLLGGFMWKRLKVYGMSHLTWMGGNLGHYTWDGQLLRKKGKLLIGNDVLS